MLRAAGADVLDTPLVRIAAAPLAGALLAAVQAVEDYDWVVFSSVNGVDLFVRSVVEIHGDVRPLARCAVACVGPVTAEAAHRHGIRADAIPDSFIGDAIAGAIGIRQNVAGKRILLARAAGAREALPRLLRADGAVVDDVEVYSIMPDEAGLERLAAALAADAVDVITFTSGSAVRFFRGRMDVSARVVVAVIGPATAEAALEHGLQAGIQAVSHTTEGLVEAIAAHYAPQGGMRRS